MLADRPTMGRYVRRYDALWSWAASRFGGLGLGGPVFWDPTPPAGCDAESVPERRMLRIREIRPAGWIAFERMWAAAVYEFANLENARCFARLRQEARKYDREGWIREGTRLEFLAVRATRDFYLGEWAGWVADLGTRARLARCWARMLATLTVFGSGDCWYLAAPDDYEAWATSAIRSSVAWRFWGDYYDRNVAAR